YAMCTGHSPFRAETMVAVLRRLCDEDPRPVREVNPEVPDWLAQIVARLHEKNPSERFQSAEELAELLSRHLAHLQQPALIPRPAPLVRRRKANPAPRRLALAIALMSMLGLAAAGAWRWGGAADALDAEQSNAQASISLAEWNLFERELELAGR